MKKTLKHFVLPPILRMARLYKAPIGVIACYGRLFSPFRDDTMVPQPVTPSAKGGRP